MKLSEKIAIYGAGALGKLCLKFFESFGYKVKFFIDELTKEKHVSDIPIYKIKDVSDKNLSVCICISYDTEKVRDKLQKEGFSHIITLKDLKNLNLFQERVELKSKNVLHKLQKITRRFDLVILDSDLKGGGTEYIKEYIKHEKSKFILWFKIFPLHLVCPELISVELVYNQKTLFSEILFDIKSIEKLKIGNGSKVIINNLQTYPLKKVIEVLKNIKKTYEAEFVYNVHDFFCICPNIFLINLEKIFCNLPKSGYCKRCLEQNNSIEICKWLNLSNFKFLESELIKDINLWRMQFNQLFEIVDQVACFSNSSRELLLRVYPFIEKKIKVVPHKVDWIRLVKISTDFAILNIGIIGNLNIAKGAEVVLNLYNYLKSNRIKNVKLHIFGKLITDKPLKEDEWLKIYGPYRKEKLSELVEQYNINVIFIPSICPETFCYTAEEGMKMGLPVAVFDIGAPAERVKAYEKGIILDYKKLGDPKYILNEFTNFIKNERSF